MSVNGVYRGIAVDTNDPLGLGRVRVQVPQVLGTSASGWAFPAWAGDDTQVWPKDRLPKAGQGVWVLFEDADKLTWLSVFGTPEESIQVYDDLAATYATVAVLDLPVLPAGIAVTVSGSLLTRYGEVPGPGAMVMVQKTPTPDDDTTWEDIGPAAVSPDGDWSLDYARPSAETGWFYRVSFDGLEPFGASTSDPQEMIVPEFGTKISWSDPAAFPWKREVVVTGSLHTDPDLVPCSGCRVDLRVRATGTTTFPVVASGTTDRYGKYEIRWTRPEAMTAAIDVKVVWSGSHKYDYAQAAASYPAVSVPTLITWTPPTIRAYGQSAVFSGNVTSAEYGTPYPLPVVWLEVRDPSPTVDPGGVWTSTQVRALPDAMGNWSLQAVIEHTAADWRCRMPAVGVFTEAITPVITAIIQVGTTVSAPTIPATVVYGQQVTASGTVVDELGRPVRHGSVVLRTNWTSGPPGAGLPQQVDEATATVTSSGTYSLVSNAHNGVGPKTYQVLYQGDATTGYQPSTSAVVSRSVGLAATALTKGSTTHTSAAFTWKTVPGAEAYEVQMAKGTGAWTSGPDQTTTSKTWSGLVADSDYSFQVRGKRTVGGTSTKVYSAWAAPIKCHTGHPATPASGSLTYTAYPHCSGAWRSLDGWTSWTGNASETFQGRYGTSGWYRSVIHYDGAAFRNWVTAHYGGDVLKNLVWAETRIHMYRIASSYTGSGAAVPIRLYVTDSTARVGGEPVLQGAYDSTSLARGGNAWCPVPAHWGGHVLLEQVVGGRTIHSFGIARDTDDSYSHYNAQGIGEALLLYVRCTWNFTRIAEALSGWY